MSIPRKTSQMAHAKQIAFPPFSWHRPIHLFDPLFHGFERPAVQAYRDRLVSLAPNAARELVHARTRIESPHGRQMWLPFGRLDIVVDDVGRVGHSGVEHIRRREREFLRHGESWHEQ